jgi:caffeoyl-CoA O-methyltransferase
MIKSFAQIDPVLADYADTTFQPQDDVLLEITTRAKAAGLPGIHVGAMDGLHIEIITRAIGATRAVEFGTLGGYSGVCILRGMPEEGRLYTLEIDPKHAEVAREAFELAGVGDRAEILLGPAMETAAQLESTGPFDLIFIDADKGNYGAYLDWAADHVRVGGVVMVDNTFAWGHVHHRGEETADIVHALNIEMASGGKFRSTILPTGEGLTIGVRLP